jgi:hypothetical protein
MRYLDLLAAQVDTTITITVVHALGPVAIRNTTVTENALLRIQSIALQVMDTVMMEVTGTI